MRTHSTYTVQQQQQQQPRTVLYVSHATINGHRPTVRRTDAATVNSWICDRITDGPRGRQPRATAPRRTAPRRAARQWRERRRLWSDWVGASRTNDDTAVVGASSWNVRE